MPCSATKLEEARAYERREGSAIPAQDRPAFHLTPWVGWMNDPNGFCYYQGAEHGMGEEPLFPEIVVGYAAFSLMVSV